MTEREIQFQRAKMAPNAHPLVRLIWREIAAQRTSQEIVAARAGVSSSGMRKWRLAQRNPTAYQLEAVLNVLGYDLVAAMSADAGHVMGRELPPQKPSSALGRVVFGDATPKDATPTAAAPA